MKKIKTCELQYDVSQETLARFQINFVQTPDKRRSLYSVVYISEKAEVEDKALIERTKKMLMTVLSNPKAVVRTEQLEETSTDSSFDSTRKIHEQSYEE